MRVLAIGDIHGYLQAFDALLDMVQPQSDDLLITLGDYVDRGPDTAGVITRLIELQSRCRLVPLMGNHDWTMLEARGDAQTFRDWFHFGGEQTLASYNAEPHWNLFQDVIPTRHWRFLEECVPYFETDTHLFVHANVEYDIPLNAQSESTLFWDKLDPDERRCHESGKTMICGHTAQKSGRPLVLEHVVCIDTWIYGDGGWLTCLDVEREAYWQANAQGETRMGLLDFRAR